MASIKQAVNSLSLKVSQIADSSGAPKTLATQEVTWAFKNGIITKAQRDILQRALSDGGNDVARIRKTLKTYVQAFERGDTNKNGRSDKAERAKHQKALDAWMWKAASTQVPQAEKDALRKKTLQVDTEAQSGKIIQRPVFAVGTLLEKLDKLLPADDVRARYKDFQNENIRTLTRDGKLTKADATKITHSYNWTQHNEFTALIADKQLEFERGAKAIITKFLSGPLPE